MKIEDMKPGETYIAGPSGIRTLNDALMDELAKRLAWHRPDLRWQHDCSACEYIGTIRGPLRVKSVDIYRQCGTHIVTRDASQPYLMRRSSSGPDYTSGMNAQDLVLTLFREGWI